MCGASVPLVVDVARMLCAVRWCVAHPSVVRASLRASIRAPNWSTVWRHRLHTHGYSTADRSACLRAPLGDAVAQCVCARLDVPLPLELLPLGLLSVQAETQTHHFQPCRRLPHGYFGHRMDSPAAELQCS